MVVGDEKMFGPKLFAIGLDAIPITPFDVDVPAPGGATIDPLLFWPTRLGCPGTPGLVDPFGKDTAGGTVDSVGVGRLEVLAPMFYNIFIIVIGTEAE